MKTWITSALLAASALVPAIASAQQAPDDRGQQRGPEQRGNRPQGERNRGPRPAGGDAHGQVQAGAQVQQRQGANAQVQAGGQFQQRGGPDRNPQGRPDGRPGDRGGYVGRGDPGRPNGGPGGPGGYAVRGEPGRDGRPGGGPAGYAGRDDGRGGWNRGWRGDRRYDYGGYRNQNRAAFRLPRYYAPASWHGGYRRFSVGVTLGYGLFGGNYWIGNPYAYRLPPAYGPYRWVRYFNDALLVDTRSGYVVDAVYDIFS